MALASASSPGFVSPLSPREAIATHQLGNTQWRLEVEIEREPTLLTCSGSLLSPVMMYEDEEIRLATSQDQSFWPSACIFIFSSSHI